MEIVGAVVSRGSRGMRCNGREGRRGKVGGESVSFEWCGGGSVDQATLVGERTMDSGWGIRVDQLGSPATRGSLTEKCRESRTVGRIRPAAKTEFVPALYASHLRDSRETD